MIHFFAGHLGISRKVYHLLDRVYWPGLRQDVRSYLASCAVSLAAGHGVENDGTGP